MGSLRLLALVLGLSFVVCACGDAPRDEAGAAERDPAAKSRSLDLGMLEPAAPVEGTLRVEIPEAIMPLARGDKYETPLSEALGAEALGGEVVGGGSMVDADGSIEYVDVVLEVTDIDAAVDVLRAKLREIGAPQGTLIHVEDSDRAPIPVW